jgi:hypothetical protein
MTKKQRVTRAVYAAYVVLVALFVVSSVVQIARRVFGGSGSDGVTGSDARFPPVGPACGQVLTDEIQAIESARITASTERGGDAARQRYQSARPSREPIALVRARCAGDPQETAALAALARFDRAAEAHAVRDATELSPVRQEAQSFIRGSQR